jgi:predicted TIM-barrel fold metal-dependent hydrolase
VQGLASLTPEEKERILWRNLEALLGLEARAGRSG